MKLFPLLMALSLAANAVLAVMAWRHGRAASDRGRHETTTGARTAPRPSTPANPTAKIDAGMWTQLAASDSTTFAAQLRANGFPPAMVRAMIHALVREQLAPRYRTIAEEAAKVPYWRGAAFSLSADPKLELARRALDREAAERVMQLLGSADEEWSENARRRFRRSYGDVDLEKVSEMHRIQADYADLIAEVRSESRGLMLPHDAEKLALLEKEMRSDLDRVFTPSERENIELRTSQTAHQLRSQLASFGPSEEEFRAIFRLQRTIDERLGQDSAAASPEQRRAGAEAQKQLAAEIERTLGPDRYADYLRTTDPVWLTADRFLAQMGLPTSATPQLLAVQQELSRRASAVRMNAGLTPELQQLQLAAIAQEARTRLTPLIGERGLTVYQQNLGAWLRALPNSSPR